MSDENSVDRDKGVVCIGNKPLMKYVTAVVVQFNSKDLKKVTIMARGKFISKAVDVAEIVRKKFLKEKNLAVSEIKIDSEDFTGKDNKPLSVSTLTIVLESQ